MNRREEARSAREAWALLDRLGLAAHVHEVAATLPFGLLRLLELARALALRPRLLLLDEPASGLGGEQRGELARLIREIREEGVTVVLVEHGVEMVLQAADRSVRDNLLLSGFGRGLPRSRMEERLCLVYSLFPVLAERQRAQARSLSGGQQQMLAIGRALMSEPCVLLMDEPLLGLATLIISELLGLLQQLCAEGLSVVPVEQNARAALSVANRAYVLERGQIVQSGPAWDLQADPAVQRAYLGGPLGLETSREEP
ncbi:MAG: ATP-binding cassette domain-containing protein [Armatimonadetes bacterium]|nr:ATP-binding cassette domain-containing protein [Armatimonadota bacterium]MDW8152892.1 ATP-binding cassette domain-containing protein [Armatimonadota bacterium]